MRVKREKRGKGLQSPPEYADYPKTEIVVAVVAAVDVVAKRGTAVIRIVAPGTAPQHFCSIFVLANPSTPIRGCALIIRVIIVLTPFPNVSVHIVQTKGISYLKIAYWCRLFSIDAF